MRSATKKITAYLFIFLGLLPMLFLLSFSLHRHMIRQEMKEKMKDGEMQTVVLPENKVVWMDDHEIWVNEHMFDIHSKELVNGVYTFTGMYDEEETKLVAKEKNTSEKQQEENKLLSHFFKSIQVFYREQQGLNSWSSISSTSYGKMIPGEIISPFRAIDTPPPRGFAKYKA